MSGDRIYCYPNSNVLKNSFDIRDPLKLEVVERQYTGLRLSQLELKPIIGRFDLQHLMDIHRFLFQDVYPFAGKLRQVDIAKGNTYFCRSEFLVDEGLRISKEIQRDNFLRGTSADQFAKRAADYFADLNMLHPFREGNGRSVREFIRTLALNAGYRIDWSRVEPERIVEASIRSVTLDNRGLENLIRAAIVNQQPDRSLNKDFEIERKPERDR